MSVSITETDILSSLVGEVKFMDVNKSLMVSPVIPKGDKYFPVDVVNKLYDVIDNARDKAYVMYHIETGLRVSDVVSTEIVHVDWQLLKTYTYDHKKDAWRWVFFPEKVKSVLKMWLKQRQIDGVKSRLLFPFCGKTCNRILRFWCERIGFVYASRVGSHWCRHTFIKLSRRVGRDIKAVQQNTGDSIKTLLEWYSDLSGEEMRLEIEGKPIT